MDYIGAFLVFLGALLAIKGATWNDEEKGWRKITAIGWASSIIALMGLIVAFYQIHTSNLSSSQKSKELKTILRNSEVTSEQLKQYQEVVSEIRAHSERQLQTTMIQYVVLSPDQIWEAPNIIYPGSIVEFFLWKGALELQYGARRVFVRSSWNNHVRIPIIGNSGEELRWKVKNVSGYKDEGKIMVVSTPRIRSSDWSWLEEKLDKLPE